MTATIVVARNWATASSNAIHADDVAATYGFGGGLVPGVGLFAYLVHPALEQFGPGWLAAGTLSARFTTPVYESEEITVEVVPSGEARVLDEAGEVRATGMAGTGPGAAPDPSGYEVLAPPEEKPAADDVELVPGQALGTVGWTYRTKLGQAHLDELGVRAPPGLEASTAHPGYLLRLANDVLAVNVSLGPWIHTGSEVALHRRVVDGERLEARARVAKSWEKRDNRWVELDVLVLADGHPAVHARHTAIYRLAPPTT